MAKCSFCGENLQPGTGFLFVKKEGAAFFFCSRKCERNLLQLKRKPGTTKWTKTYRLSRETAKPEEKAREGPVKEAREKPKKGKRKRARRKKKKR